MESIVNNFETTHTPTKLIHHSMDQEIASNIQTLQARHDAAWEAMRASHHHKDNKKGGDRHHKKTHHGKKGAAHKSHYKHGQKKPVRHHRSAHKGAGAHKGKEGHHNSKTGHGGKKNGGGHIGHKTDGGSKKHGKEGHHGNGKEGHHNSGKEDHHNSGKEDHHNNGKEVKDGNHQSHDNADGNGKVDGKHPAKDKGSEHTVDGKKQPTKGGEHPAQGKRPKDHDKQDGSDKTAGEDKKDDGGEKKKGGDGKESAKGAKNDEKKTSGSKGNEKGVAGGKDKAKEDKGNKSPQNSNGSLPGAKTGPPTPADKAIPLDGHSATPVQNGEGIKTIPGSPFFTNAGPNIPGSPNHPLSGGDPGSSKSIATAPSTGNNDNNKTSGTRILTYTLIPLTIIAGAVYGVVAYRRKNTRRRALCRRLQEDAEAAAAMSARTGGGGDDDDASSLMSAVSYRPPAPFASEVDVTTETMEMGSNPEIVVGNGSHHLISAPKRDEGHLGDYQDYSHVCQSQMLGKKCSNHSISCFVALNHSNGGLNALAAPRTPSASASRVLVPMVEQSAAAASTSTTTAAAISSEKQDEEVTFSSPPVSPSPSIPVPATATFPTL
ncbi:hypothetical protein BGX24_006169 [Mortierella sp. AD032]|nr:hypothetical protein BGX24_006169 [Mortierella sp. AD032]